MKPRFFKTPADLRQWLKMHHASVAELWVGFHKKDSGKQSITWPESVDEALCFGWIDGIRKSIDETSYMIRFTPRRTRSIWSTVNIRRANELLKQKLMQPAGLKAFAARQEYRSGIYSYEQRTADLPDHYGKLLKKNYAAWKFFHAQSPYYKKAINWWVLCAKKEETRLKRLNKLIEDSAHGRRIPFMPTKKSKAKAS
ncbi:MAG TPA: YdeI/OmpD-associated family protein [Pyrinomonadaceae bacterium]|nr:YdeI/OmpD-associated family protein [Pyrinomonadaceae bacterium]